MTSEFTPPRERDGGVGESASHLEVQHPRSVDVDVPDRGLLVQRVDLLQLLVRESLVHLGV